MFGRIGDGKYRSGAARLRNMVATPTGAAVRRPGTRFVRETKTSSARSVIRKFNYSSTAGMAIEIGAGYFRFYESAAAITYATPRIISSADAGTEVITTSAAHGFSIGESVRLLYGAGASLPGADDVTTYTVDTTPTDTTLTLTGLNITGAVVGSVALIDAADMPAEYVGSEVLSLLDATANTAEFATAHSFSNGDPVNLTSSTNNLPALLPAGTTFYVRDLSGNGAGSTCKFAATPGGAAIDFSGSGGGTITLHYAYSAGDLVHTTGVGVYYVEIDLPSGDSANFYLQPLGSSDCVFELPNPYVESNLYYLKFRQQGAVLTITHPDHPPRQLTRTGEIAWTDLEITDYGPSLDAPVISSITRAYGEYWNVFLAIGTTVWETTGARHTLGPLDAVYLEASIGTGTNPSGLWPAGVYMVNELGSGSYASLRFSLRTLEGGTGSNALSVTNAVVRRVSASSDNSETYVVTAIDKHGDESIASAESTASYNPLFVIGSSNTVNWSAVTGAQKYRVYKKQTGLFGFIGETDTTSFKDDNITPDLSITPPRQDDTLDDPGNPGCSTYFEQRTIYAGKESDAQQIWMTRTGTESSLTYHIPVIDTDRINFTLASSDNNYIQHVVPLANLLVLTTGAEFVVTPVNTDAITPTSFRARPVSYIGSSHVAPVVSNNTLLFCAARGGHVREFGRTSDQGYSTGDVSLRAAHLFDGNSIVDSAYMKAPYSIAWFVNDDGELLGFTYAPEEELGGWHWHDTQGFFESICVVPEGDEDALYCIVRRSINGATKRYVERMEPFAFTNLQSSWHVDCGLRYGGASTTVVTGLDHLEGETVQVLGSIHIRDEEVVSGGSITMSGASSTATIGLGYDSELVTLPVTMQVDAAFGRGRTHNVNKLWLRVQNTARFEAGPDEDQMVPALDIALGTYAASEDIDVHIPGDWTDTGQVWVRQTDPVPLTVISLCAEVSIGS